MNLPISTQIKVLFMPKPPFRVANPGEKTDDPNVIPAGIPLSEITDKLDAVFVLIAGTADPSIVDMKGRPAGGSLGVAELARVDFSEWLKRCQMIARGASDVPDFISHPAPWLPPVPLEAAS